MVPIEVVRDAVAQELGIPMGTASERELTPLTRMVCAAFLDAVRGEE